MNVPRKMQEIASNTQSACIHQCTKCGLIYQCGEAKCDRPFYNGVCARSAAFTREVKTTLSLS